MRDDKIPVGEGVQSLSPAGRLLALKPRIQLFNLFLNLDLRVEVKPRGFQARVALFNLFLNLQFFFKAQCHFALLWAVSTR